MIEYNYNFEITSNIAFFESVFDDTLIKRYDAVTKRAVDSIKVNYIYGPKSKTLQDLRGQPDAVKYPIVAITHTGMGRDNDRIKNKIENITYKTETGEYVSLQAIPWNMTVQMDVLAKYQADINQIITNFAVLCNPYVVFSWREPKSGKEVRSEVHWDGNINMIYPTHGGDVTPDQDWEFEATTTFTIKTFLYRTAVENDKPICSINLNVIPTDTFFCSYSDLSAYTKDNGKDVFGISGVPQLRFVDQWYFKTGDSPTIRVMGDGFNGTYGLFVSGSDPQMYPLTTYYPTSGSTESFGGYAITSFEIPNSEQLIFTLPPASAFGFCDIIAVNQCGWSKLTTDANRCNRVLNPYPNSLPEHYSWCVEQYPYLNGLIISNNLNDNLEINCDEDIIVVENDVVDRDAILEQIRNLMELAGITAEEI